MTRRPPISTPTYTLLPDPTLFRSQPHQLGRRLHRAHSGIELVLAVAVPMDEHRQVAGGERPSAQRRQRSEEHTSELQSLMRNSYAGFCLKKKKLNIITTLLNSLISHINNTYVINTLNHYKHN